MATAFPPACSLRYRPVDIELNVPLLEQICTYGFCEPTHEHSCRCKTHAAFDVAAARLHWKVRLAREKR